MNVNFVVFFCLVVIKLFSNSFDSKQIKLM